MSEVSTITYHHTGAGSGGTINRTVNRTVHGSPGPGNRGTVYISVQGATDRRPRPVTGSIAVYRRAAGARQIPPHIHLWGGNQFWTVTEWSWSSRKP
ncbi:TPA: hypothetical protein ACISZV_003231 [Salmonella enterica subsp. enterica serovar Birkenhead]